MRIVLDTNVLLSAYIWENSVAQKLIFRLVSIGAELYTSAELMIEFQRVLKRDFNCEDEQIMSFMEEIFLVTKIITPIIKIDIIKNDPDDNKVIECAIASRSDYILSFDKHLLNLHEYAGIKIIRPDIFLSSL